MPWKLILTILIPLRIGSYSLETLAQLLLKVRKIVRTLKQHLWNGPSSILDKDVLLTTGPSWASTSFSAWHLTPLLRVANDILPAADG